jgi:hypothetical protein
MWHTQYLNEPSSALLRNLTSQLKRPLDRLSCIHHSFRKARTRTIPESLVDNLPGRAHHFQTEATAVYFELSEVDLKTSDTECGGLKEELGRAVELLEDA